MILIGAVPLADHKFSDSCDVVCSTDYRKDIVVGVSLRLVRRVRFLFHFPESR